jgi:hypothetical protein
MMESRRGYDSSTSPEDVVRGLGREQPLAVENI